MNIKNTIEKLENKLWENIKHTSSNEPWSHAPYYHQDFSATKTIYLYHAIYTQVSNVPFNLRNKTQNKLVIYNNFFGVEYIVHLVTFLINQKVEQV